MVLSSRNASSSPFRQHQPLQREHAERATRAAKPVGTGRRGAARRSRCFALRRSFRMPIRCSRRRRTRSGATGASGFSLRGTITGRLSLSMTGCFRGMQKHNGSVPDGPASPCQQQQGKLDKRPADPHGDVGRVASSSGCSMARPDIHAVASWLPTACAAMGLAQRGLLPVVRYPRSGLTASAETPGCDRVVRRAGPRRRQVLDGCRHTEWLLHPTSASRSPRRTTPRSLPRRLQSHSS